MSLEYSVEQIIASLKQSIERITLKYEQSVYIGSGWFVPTGSV